MFTPKDASDIAQEVAQQTYPEYASFCSKHRRRKKGCRMCNADLSAWEETPIRAEPVVCPKCKFVYYNTNICPLCSTKSS